MLIFNKGSTNLLIAVLVDLHAQNVNGRGIEAEKEREKESARDKLLHLLLLVMARKVMKSFVYQYNIFISHDVIVTFINMEREITSLIYLGTDTSVSGRVSIGNSSNLEHELANGYNSGDEYTGRTENNLTLAEWQDVSIVKSNISYNYDMLSNVNYVPCP